MTTALVRATDVPYQAGRMAADIELDFRISRFRLRNVDTELLTKHGELERIAKGYTPLQDADFVRGYEERRRELNPVFRKSTQLDGGESPLVNWLIYIGVDS